MFRKIYGLQKKTPSSYKAGKQNSTSKFKLSLSEPDRSLFCVISQQISGSHKSKLFLTHSPFVRVCLYLGLCMSPCGLT